MFKTTVMSVLMFVCLSGLTGCGKVKEAVAQKKLLGLLKENLRDADSAKFRNVRIGKTTYDVAKTKEDYAICGEVNAKNAFGAFTGFEGFVISDNIRGEPTIYMQRDKTLGVFLWAMISKELGCTSNP